MPSNLFSVLFLSTSFFFLISCSGDTVVITYSNPHDFDVKHAAIEINLNDLPFEDSQISGFVISTETDTSLPYQLDDLDLDGSPDHLFFQLDVDAESELHVFITAIDHPKSFTKMTDAVLKVRQNPAEEYQPATRFDVPSDLASDSNLVFLEGPAWESDLIGYRLYADDRNRFSILGKTTNELVLTNISENVEQMNDWGADILAVGSSLGIGTPAVLQNGQLRTIGQVNDKKIEVVANGPLRSVIRTTSKGWQLDSDTLEVVMDMEIHAHHRYTVVTLSFHGSDADPQWVTGLVRHPEARDFVDGTAGNALYTYNWGNQTPQDHKMGMALIVNEVYQPETNNNDEFSYLVNLQSHSNQIEYLFLAAWEHEPDSVHIDDEESFKNHVEMIARQWSFPLEVMSKVPKQQ